MTIDCHAHYYPPEYLAMARRFVDEPGAVGAIARYTVNGRVVNRDEMFAGLLDERIAMMDAAEIDTHVLSWAAPNLWHPEPASRALLVRTFNDACLEVAGNSPGRFKLFANVPLPHVDEAIAESARLLDQPDVVGIGMCTHVDGAPIDDERFRPAFDFWNERGTVVTFHPDGFCAPHVMSDYGLDRSLGMMFDDTIAVIRLIFSGMITRYPNITWIVPHLGGTLPFVLGRLNFIWKINPLMNKYLDRAPGEYLQHVFFDTVTTQPESIALTAEVIGTDRLVLGSDFPYASRHDLGEGRQMLVDAGLTEAQLRGVLRENIAERLGLPPQTAGARVPGAGRS